MKQKALRWSVVTVFISLAICACRDNEFSQQSEITTDIRIKRFEKELFGVDPALISNHIPEWEADYGVFFRHFCWITGLGDPSDEGFIERIRSFVTDQHNYRLYKRTMEVFPDLSGLTEQLNSAFSNYSVHFPGNTVPDVFTFISGFSRSAITDDSLLAIGIDRYLGTQEPFYKEAGIYNYLAEKMYPEKIVTDCMKFWGETEFPFNDSVNNLIVNMIYEGRTLFFTRAMIPGQHDSLTLGFSNKDILYMEKHERSMWAFLVEHKLLFSTDRLNINKFVAEGPFTTDFGRNSPARAAVWIGYRITESYMKKNPDINIKQLMSERDYLKILNGSSYNP